MKKNKLFVWILMLLLLTACSKGETAKAPEVLAEAAAEVETVAAVESLAEIEKAAVAEPIGLTVSAAASMTQVLAEIQTLYLEEQPHVTITFNFGSSGSLQKQIEEGAPVDVFISASKGKMTPLKDAGLLLDDQVVDLLINDMVLITPKDSAVTTFEDLASETITHFAMGEPESVPAGKYALEVLTSLKLNEAVADKTVLAKDVKEVLSWVETGNADAGMVYVTDIYNNDAIKIVATAPEGSHGDIIYPAAVIKASAQPEAAQDFLDFLSTQAAQDLFIKYGFKIKSVD